jgi:hypothetical protein
MLSFSNFGSTKHPLAEKVQRAVQLVKNTDPELMINGEMMADTAIAQEIIEETYPFSKLKGGANVLVFPDLTSANTCYKLSRRIGGAGKRSASTSGRRVGRCGRWPEVDTYGSVHLGNKWTLRSGQLLRENHRDDGGRRERSVGSSNRL